MTWPQAVQTMGKWYQQNIHKYAADAVSYKSPPCSLLNNGGVRWDCTGYVCACLQLFGTVPLGYNAGSAMTSDPNGDFAKKCAKGGFRIMQYQGSPDTLQPYDIVSVRATSPKTGRFEHHAEIYAGKLGGKHKAWSWGNVHDGINGHQGMPCAFTNYSYRVVYRLDGISRDSGGFIGGDFGFGEGGGGTLVINLEDYKEAYPVHSEYETYTGKGGNIFEKAADNAFSMATLKQNNMIDTSRGYLLNFKNKNHTRIYSTNDAKIVLDELKLSLDTEKNDSWSNKDITQSDVDKWQKEMDALKEEAKKKAEEEKKKAEEEAKKKAEELKNGETPKDNKDAKTNNSSGTNNSTSSSSSSSNKTNNTSSSSNSNKTTNKK